MARVPIKQDRSITQPTRLPQLGQANVSADVFGAIQARALAQTAQQVGAGADKLFAIGRKLQVEDEEREAKQLDFQFAQRVREITFGTQQQPGYFALKGQDALDAADATQQSIEQARLEIASQASNNSVFDLFSSVADRRENTEKDSIARHFTAQRISANKTASSARQAEFLDEALLHFEDPGRREEILASYLAEARTFAQDEGNDPETVISIVEEKATVFHKSIIDQFLAIDDFNKAEEYFEDNKERIDGRVHAGIREDINRKAAGRITALKLKVQDAITVLNDGQVPDNIDALSAEVAAMPGRQAVAIGELLRDAISDNLVLTENRKQTIAVQVENIKQLKGANTADEVRQRKLLEKSLSKTIKAFNDGNEIQLAADLGHIAPLEPLNIFDINSITDRRAKAQVASEAFGRYVAPFSSVEVDSIVSVLKGEAGTGQQDATPDQAVAVMDNLVSGLGEQGSARLVEEVSKKDAPELAFGLLVSEDSPRLARSIVIGGRFARENKELLPKSIEREDAAENAIGNMFVEDTGTNRRLILDGAVALYASRLIDDNDLTYDPGDFEQAIKDTVGGTFKFNGRTIIPPIRGMSSSKFHDLVKKLTPADLGDTGLGGPSGLATVPIYSTGEEFKAEDFFKIFGQEPQFLTTGLDGKYFILFPGNGFILNGAGNPVIVDMKAVAEREEDG